MSKANRLRELFTTLSPDISVFELFPTLGKNKIICPDMSVGTNFFGSDVNHENLESASLRLDKYQSKYPNALLANGYLEERAFYNTPAFERTRNGHTEYRNIHLGTDFWVAAGTPLFAPLAGEVIIAHNNDFHKDYGPTLVLRHELEDVEFFTLYGHLSKDSLRMSKKGRKIEAGEELGYVGDEEENGHWVPHLHFQLITDLLSETENYNGVAFPSELDVWKRRCPNPNLIFREHLPSAEEYPLEYHSR